MNTKTLWWIIGIVAVLLIVIAIVHARNNAASSNTAATAGTSDQNVLVPTEDVSTGSIHASMPSPAVLSYQEALNEYPNSRIQFDVNCQSTPSAATYKNNTTIMLDNRSASPRTIRLGSLGDVSIKAWGFKLVKLSSNDLLPNAMAIDCGAHQNVGIITIQK